MDNVRISGSVQNGIYLAGANTSMRNCLIEDSLHNGLFISGNSGDHLIRRNTFTANDAGVRVENRSNELVLTGNRFVDNHSYGLYNNAAVEIDARNCWWGASSGPYHETGNPDGNGDTVSDNVLFAPWQEQAGISEIYSPLLSGTLVKGDLLRFSGSEPAGEGAANRWVFSDGRSFEGNAPGLVNFPETGEITVTYGEVSGSDISGHGDTRIFNVVDNVGEIPDLRVTGMQVSGNLSMGQPATISYTVRNVGDGPAAGTWSDGLWLSGDAYPDKNDLFLGAATVNRTLAPGDSYTNTIDITLPAIDEGSYNLILVADNHWQLLERHRLNNEYALPVTAMMPELTEGEDFISTYEYGRLEHYYRLVAPGGKSIILNLSGTHPAMEIFVRYGAVPTRRTYDYRVTGEQLIIPAATAGSWYITVAGNMEASGEYTVNYQTSRLLLGETSPARQSAGAELELSLIGAGFNRLMEVTLISGDETVYEADTLEVDGFDRALAVFEAGKLPAGTYTVQVSHQGQDARKTGVLEIVEGGEPNLEIDLILPSRMGYHILATVYVEYANTGDAPMPAPLLLVSASQSGREGARMTLDRNHAFNVFWSGGKPEGVSNRVQFLAAGENPGLLQPGESGRVPVYYISWERPWSMGGTFQWSVDVLDAEDKTPIDWDGLKAGMRPAYMTEDAWDVVWENIKEISGDTWGEYLAMLSRNARYLYRLGIRETGVDSLLALTFLRAEGLSPLSVFDESLDGSVAAPGDPVTFERSYFQNIPRRFALGTLGRGWAHNWQKTLRIGDDGLELTDYTGIPRFFHLDSRYPGRYPASWAGDEGSVRKVGSKYLLTEADGTVFSFDADGQLEYREDSNGNRVTCSYSDGLLTALSYSAYDDGPVFTIDYDDNGRITTLTDYHGRLTQYIYNGEYLSEVTSPAGLTTAYSYQTAEVAARHALTEIALPDGTDRYLSYDDKGRLSSVSRDGGAGMLTYSYSEGRVDATDALGDTNRYFFDYNGRMVRMENPLGEAMQMKFDTRGNMTAFYDSEGYHFSFEYDSRGNLSKSTDAMRHVTGFTHTRYLNRLDSVTDALGSRIDYGYDNRGNLVRIIYPDGTGHSWEYDESGNPVSLTNARGDKLTYSYDAAGRVTEKVYEDGSINMFSYDERGNLTEAENVEGKVIYEYCEDTDLLTKVEYPGGLWLAYEYDNAHRRSSSEDHLGNCLYYKYNEDGLLSRIYDDDADIITYTYDELLRLQRQETGNGVYTIYTYDAAGRQATLTNHQPDGEMISRFEYVYDRRGLRTSMTTHYGEWTYEYDDNGQLVRAALDSSDPEIADQVMEYEYDAVGNRVQAVVNGVTEEYDVNSLNQYTLVSIGNDIYTYTYDADGNLVAEDGPGGKTVYTYNQENRLESVTRGEELLEYRYDARGQRLGVTDNGNVIHYLTDHYGLGNMVGEYAGSGEEIARYTHGLSLAAVTRDDGDYYYSFDPTGNTSGLTGADGALLNSYAYLPFGETMSAVSAVPNLFLFTGREGVMDDGMGQYYMRARHYDPRLGRFMARDPIGLLGRDINFYRYTGNNPVSYIDPTGLLSEGAKQGMETVLDVLANAPVMPPVVGSFCDMAKAAPEVARGYVAVANYRSRLNAAADLQYNPRNTRNMDLITGTRKFYQTPRPHTSPGSRRVSGNVAPYDPNQKLSVAGFGEKNFVAAGTRLSYHIDFENLAEVATAPAQVVTINDPLCDKLDLSTFELTGIGFGDILVPVPAGRQSFETVVDYYYSDDEYEFEIEVHIEAWLEDRTLRVLFMSIDPETGMPPQDVDIGFLPPEVPESEDGEPVPGQGRGQGFVSYMIQPNEGLSSGTEIRNVAVIQFDFGMEIATNQEDPEDPDSASEDLEALVTIDALPPQSSVNELPVEINTSAFTVNWSGEDDEHGSGIGGYDIYVQADEGSWELWLEDTPDTGAEFEGVHGVTYSFCSIATDNVGHREDKKLEAEATTTLKLFGTLEVTIEPEGAREAGARWSVDGGAAWYESGEQELPVGTYTVTFKDIDNWDTPADLEDTEISENASVIESAAYIRHTGTLEVTIEPEGAREAGARWSVDGGDTWYESGARELPVGTYTITFKDIDNWDTPADLKDTEITQNATLSESAVYIRHSGILEVTIEPEGAREAGARWSVDGGDTWYESGARELPVGTYTITFKDIDNWDTPAALEDTEITKNVTVSESAVYTSVKEIIYGDVNGDGHITVGDAIMVLRAIVGLTTLDKAALERALVSGKEILSVADAILILRKIVGLIEHFPVQG